MAKYIVELESGTHIFVLGPEGIVHIGEPDVVYETIDGMQIGDAVINAKPYTEPDLEQVKRDYDAWYEKGLSDAWKAARKICGSVTDGGLNHSTLNAIFGSRYSMSIMHRFTAAEAIERLNALEQKQEQDAEIKVGDEVIRHYKSEFAEGDDAPSIFLSEEDGYFRCLAFNGRSIMIAEYPKNQYRKTGRHFPEIAAVIEKMRGEQDG